MSEQRSIPALALVPPERDDVPASPAEGLPVAAEDEAAFAALFARRYEPLRRYAFAELRDRDAAEDVVQGAFSAMWVQYYSTGATPPETALDALIFRMVQIRLGGHRRERTRMATKLGLHLTMWVGRAKRWMIPAEQLEHRELATALELAVARMSPRERQVFQLRREAGLTYEEIASSIGVQVTTVNSLMHKAQRVLRDHVTSAGFADAPVASKRGRIK